MHDLVNEVLKKVKEKLKFKNCKGLKLKFVSNLIMKKRTIYILITLMSFSLIGIIWVQAYWIHNSIIIKEAQFGQLVNEALNNVVSSLEEEESINFIHKQLVSSAKNNVVITTDSTPSVKKITKWTTKSIESDSTENQSQSFQFDFSSDSDKGNEMEMSISINGKTQTIELTNRLDKVEKILEQDSLLFSGEAKRFGDVLVKMAKEFETIDNPIEHLLEKVDIDSILSYNLSDNGIFLPFSYAVLKNDSVIKAFSSKSFSADKNAYTVNLFKHDILSFPAHLAVSFQGKHQFIFKSMWLMLICSGLFTLIILFVFISTIYYLFKQKKLSEIKNDFINNMTHEFKTPISTISLAIDSITHPKIIQDEEQINYYANIIRKENKRMNNQVESVLNTSLAEKNQLTLNKEMIDLSSFIEKITERMKLQLEATDTVFKTNITDYVLEVKADEQHLQNAICNLIDNSIKYSGKNPEVNFKISKTKTGIEFTVSDKGIGMNKETQKRVFDKFFRVQSGNIHKVKGFGIGLSYVKAIVDAHGGEIKLNSKLNEGTTVIISIPQ